MGCSVLVDSLIKRAKSFSEDDLADALEGITDYPKTGDQVTDQMLSHKKGCNKHFKDELIAEGYVLRVCKDVIPGRNDSEPCLWQEQEKPNQQSVDSYELWKEGLFYACEKTVGTYNDVIAEFLGAALHSSKNRTFIVQTACNVHARCG